MRALVIGALLLCSAVPAFAQITITSEDYQSILGTGTDTYAAVSVEGKRFDLGTLGATDNVYDFTQYEFSKSPRENRYVSPSGTTMADEYPEATHAALEQNSGIYRYYKLQEDGYYAVGAAVIMNFEIIYYHDSPQRPIYKLPLEMGTTWEHQGESVFIGPAYGITSTIEQQSEVVAAGTLVTPSGSEPCLVLRNVMHTTMEGPGFLNENKQIAYVFKCRSGLAAYVAIDTLDFDSDNPRIGYMSYTAPAQTSGVGEPIAAASCALGDVYPNPVSPVTEAAVTWSADRSVPVTVALYDMRGVKVATVYEGHTSPGTHSVPVNMQGLPQGMYFLRMTTPEGIQTRKVFRY